jgi:hypothetical protein
MANDDVGKSTIQDELRDIENVDDDTPEDQTFSGAFAISSFGTDFDVDGLVKRLRSGAYYKPDFQREYVWNQKHASRFIESLLMGLPVPGIFVYRLENNKHLIIDGLQRLTTLLYFYDGVFKGKEFALSEVRDPWKGRTYRMLEEEDRLKLNDAIIHTTIFKQDSPVDDYKSVYEVFERINTGGLKLSPQEIRACVAHEPNEAASFVKLLKELNGNALWRSIYGPISARLKDQELILRFLCLKFNEKKYARPFRTYLDEFIAANKTLDVNTRDVFSRSFVRAISALQAALGRGVRLFRPDRAINAAVYDSILVAVATAIEQKNPVSEANLKSGYNTLIADKDFINLCSRSTADEDRLESRMKTARKAFGLE